MMGNSALELVVAAVQGKMPVGAREVPMLVGNKHRGAFAGAKRIVFVWRGGKLSVAERHRVEQQITETEKYTLRPLWDNAARVDAYIYAKSDDALEALWVQLLTGCRDALGTASRPTDYLVQSQTDAAGHTSGDYSTILQRFEWEMTLCEATGRKYASTAWRRPKPVMVAFNTVVDLDSE